MTILTDEELQEKHKKLLENERLVGAATSYLTGEIVLDRETMVRANAIAKDKYQDMRGCD